MAKKEARKKSWLGERSKGNKYSSGDKGGKPLKALRFARLFCLALLVYSCSPDAPAADTSPAACFEGAVYEVTSTDDIIFGACNAHCTLREALKAANECTGVQTINLPAGFYTLTMRGPDDERGDLNILDSVILTGESPNTTIIQGDSTWNNRIFAVQFNARAQIQGVTIQGGNPPIGSNGGGILNEGTLLLQNVELYDNTARGNGGAIFNSGRADLFEVAIESNRASSSGVNDETGLPTGCGGGLASIGSMQIQNSVVATNHALNGAGLCFVGNGSHYVTASRITLNGHQFLPNRGGGIYANSFLEISSSQITENHAIGGGGIYFEGTSAGLQINGSFISGNYAYSYVPRAGGVLLAGDGSGGGLLVENSDAANGVGLSLVGSVVTGNIAERSGGGLQFSGSADFSLPDQNPSSIYATAMVNNTAFENGGGINILSGMLRITNSTVGNNIAHANGGGLNFVINGARLDLLHSTIANNIPEGIYNAIFTPLSGPAGSGLYLNNSLVGFNEVNCRNYIEDIVSNGWNVEDRDQCGFDHAEDRTGVGAESLDPHLVYDGNTYYFTPLGAALNFIPAPAECLVNIDQIGTDRPSPLTGGCDAGAIETIFETAIAPLVVEDERPDATATQNANCRVGPSEAFEVHDFLYEGESVSIDGRNADSTWVWLLLPNITGHCWIFTAVLDISDSLDLVPIIASPVLPTPTVGSDNGEQQDPNGNGGDEQESPENCGPDEYWSIETQSCEPFG